MILFFPVIPSHRWLFIYFFVTLSEEEALCDPFFLVMQWRLFFWVKYYLVVPQGATAYTQIRTIGEISYGVEAARPVRVKEIARPSHRHELQKYLKGQTRRAVRFHCFASNICTHGMHMRSTSSLVFAWPIRKDRAALFDVISFVSVGLKGLSKKKTFTKNGHHFGCSFGCVATAHTATDRITNDGSSNVSFYFHIETFPKSV